MSFTRRQIVGSVIAGISLPVLENLLGKEPEARAADADWVATIKPAALEDGTFHRVAGQPILLARKGDEIYALNNKCTHKSCVVAPLRRRKGVLQCPCHEAEFDLQGNVLQEPAEKPLARHGIRLNADGTIEVTTKKLDNPNDPSAVLTIK